MWRGVTQERAKRRLAKQQYGNRKTVCLYLSVIEHNSHARHVPVPVKDAEQCQQKQHVPPGLLTRYAALEITLIHDAVPIGSFPSFVSF